MKILIADDDPAFRNLLEETLARWGYEVVVSRDGNEAWEELHAVGAPQLAIFDWLMPGMDGLEVSRRRDAAAGMGTQAGGLKRRAA